MAGKEYFCVDKFGRSLVGGVQVVRNCTIPGHSLAIIYCRVSDCQFSRRGFIEGRHTRVQLARSLNRLIDRGEILVQCVNPFLESVALPSWFLLGHFHTIQEGNVGPSLGKATEGPHQSARLYGGEPSQNTSRNCTGQPVRAAQATRSAKLWPSCYASTGTCSVAETMT